MYNYIIGKVTIIRGDYIVLENNGIGYQIKVANPFKLKLNDEYKIYTHLYIREDSHELFGFLTQKEKDLFLKLISVKGIGPKTALAILGSTEIDKIIEAIETKNSKYLQRFPGIGPKAAQQIVLDLFGKVDFTYDEAKEDEKATLVKDALKSLGYSAIEIKKVEKIIFDNLDKDTNEILKIALKNII